MPGLKIGPLLSNNHTHGRYKVSKKSCWNCDKMSVCMAFREIKKLLQSRHYGDCFVAYRKGKMIKEVTTQVFMAIPDCCNYYKRITTRK